MCGTIAILLSCVLTISYIDPFLQYHKPNPELSYVLDTNLFAYTNPGIAKNYDYDTVIMGSSMSRSFLPSYIDEVFHAQTVKLSMAEARGRDFQDLLKIIEKNANLKRVIIGLDAFAFSVDKDYSSYDKPMYLYDKNLLNDLPYVLNMDNLIRCFDALLDSVHAVPGTTMDEYQNYALDHTFGEEKVLKILQNEYTKERNCQINSQEEISTITENLNANLIPFLQRNPDVQFLFYFPPYSIVRWGIDKAPFQKLDTMRIIAENLLPYDNAKLYFYQGRTDVITNLNHYMDTIHFDSEIANDIVDSICQGENLLTEENYLQYFSEFGDFIAAYDYEQLLEHTP